MKKNVLILMIAGMLSLPALVKAQAIVPWAKIACGGEFNIGLKTDGSLWGWGSNTHGECGVVAGSPQLLPIRIGTDNDWKDISAGGMHVLALKKNGTIWAWGNGGYGQVGDGGSAMINDAPVQVGTDSDWVSINASYASSYAIKKSGAFYSWGFNFFGELGDSASDNIFQPHLAVQKKFRQIAGGSIHAVGIAADGSLWGWGNGIDGETGQGVTKSTNAPIQIGKDTDWVWVTSGGQSSMAMKRDGSIWAWGASNRGQSGTGVTTNVLSPTQIGTDKDWKYITAGSSFCFGIKTDGSLWGWGSNVNGELGLGTDSVVSSPKMIGTEKTWTWISGATGTIHAQTFPLRFYGSHSVGVKSGNNGYCATGINSQYQLGSEDTLAKTSFDCSLGLKTGVKNAEQQHLALGMYPNPAFDHIVVTSPEEHSISLRIFDLTGKEILLKHIDNGRGDIDINTLPSGAYIIEAISTHSGAACMQKLLVAR